MTGNRNLLMIAGTMKLAEVIVLLLCASIGVVYVGGRLRIPYPIALVLGGLAISLLPGIGEVRLDPEIIFLIFLPPLLYSAAWQTSLHDFRANLRPIVVLGVGLVLFTTVTVGLAVHFIIPDVPLAAAFALGAIVSPPDAIAASAIAHRMGLPRQIITILEGESLVNDATGLVALRFAIAAMMTGGFSFTAALGAFFWVVIGGTLIGLITGLIFAKLTTYLRDNALVITSTLLAPFLAYLAAERFHVSGVLAVVTAGLYFTWRGPELISASTRITALAFWETLVFLLNCVVFILIGLQLPSVMLALQNHSMGELIVYAAVISFVVIIVRPLWVFPGAVISRILNKRVRRCEPVPPKRHLAIISWSGMRGVVSLAAALGLPATLNDGSEFPERDLIIFLSFTAILATLVVQGLTLPFLIRRLGVKDSHNAQHERQVRLKLAQAALSDLKTVASTDRTNDSALKAVTHYYLDRVEALTDEQAEILGWSDHREKLVHMRQLRRHALKAERQLLLQLRKRNEVHDELMRRLEHEIDLEELRLEA